tara:strand:+ start:867 stop:1730 length:864 start_codon:yes stop_codon:yes gene_type:complete
MKNNTLLNEQAAPVVGEFWCNGSSTPTSQGNGCIEIIDANHPIYNNSSNIPYPGVSQPWLPGVPMLMAVSQVSPAFGPFYSSQQSCEASCGNHYFQNCMSWNNGNSVGNVSFPNLTTSEKHNFCLKCNDLPNSTIRSHPYCWCLDNGTGSPPVPPLGSSTAIYNCPDNDDNTALGCTDPTALNYNPLATFDDGSCEYEQSGKCEKCCCKKGDHLPIGQKCAPGTEISLSHSADPCRCPQGTIETPCKSIKPTGTGPISTGSTLGEKEPKDKDKFNEQIKRIKKLITD